MRYNTLPGTKQPGNCVRTRLGDGVAVGAAGQPQALAHLRVEFTVDRNTDGAVGTRTKAEQLLFEIQRLRSAAVDVIIHAQSITNMQGLNAAAALVRTCVEMQGPSCYR